MLATLEALINYLLPRSCVMCGFNSGDPSHSLCYYCAKYLPWCSNRCYRCGNVLDAAVLCQGCRDAPPPYDHLCAVFNYTPPIDIMLNRLKYGKQLYIADLFAKLLFLQLIKSYESKDLPEVIMPMPQHISCYRQQGFNQALEISTIIAKRLHLPIDLHSCIRQDKMQAKSKKSDNNHPLHVEDAFLVQPCPYKHVAIITDVVFSGATVRALSFALHKAGAMQIDVWCVSKS